MRKLITFLFATILLTSCMQEEKELLDDLISKTSSKNVKLYYTTETIPKTRRTIDFEVDGSSRVKKDEDAVYIASRTALVILEKLDKTKLDENESIRIKFTNPDFPNSSPIDAENYYDFDIADLRKATAFIYLSENIIRGYYLGNETFVNDKMDSTEIKRVDSLLSIVLPKSNLTNYEFLKFATMTDSLNNKYTGVLNSITTSDGVKSVTIIFNNKTRKVLEVN